MRHYFLDTNILLDFLLNRETFGKFALEIFKKKLNDDFVLLTSDNSFLTTYYIISKHTNNTVASEKTKNLLTYLEVVPITKSMLQLAYQLNFRDYEDAVQYQCALSLERLDGIITRNKSDFKSSLLPIFSPEEVV